MPTNDLRPIPIPDDVSKPFWDACNEKRLVVQICTACNRMQFPFDKTCSGRGACGSSNLETKEVAGRGKVDDYVVIYDTRLRSWAAVQPYNVAMIQLEEDPGVQFLSNLPANEVDTVTPGASVEVEFIEVVAGQWIPEWKVVS